MHDVARTAGVSIATVSRALARSPKVAESTRERVASVAQSLGYTPNLQAAALRGGRTGVIGLLVPDLSNPFFATIAQGVSEAADQHELGVFIVDSREKHDERSLLRKLVRQTDGVILAAPRDLQADLSVIGDVPAVVINQEGPRAVLTDVADGVRQAVAHLVGLGHERIAYLGGPASSWGDDRRRAALAEETVLRRSTKFKVIALGAFAPSVHGGEAAADAVEATSATAVLTYNDIVAVGLIRALRIRGTQVPTDLSVVSFDGTFLAPLVTPALTSAGTDLRALGRAAAHHLITPDESATLIQPIHLTVRESTAAPPGSGA